MLGSRLLSDRTYGPTFHELRGFRLFQISSVTPCFQHVLYLNNALAKFKSQIPFMVMIQGAVMFA